MFAIELIILIFEILPLFFSIIIFFPINKKKQLKTKEDELFLQKNIITFITFSIDIIIGALKMIKLIEDGKNVICKIGIFIFNIYIILMVFYNFFLCLELYYTYSNPIHLFNRLFKQKRYNYIHEFFIIIILAITIVADSIFFNKFKKVYENDNTRLIIPNFYKFGVIVLFSLISVLKSR